LINDRLESFDIVPTVLVAVHRGVSAFGLLHQFDVFRPRWKHLSEELVSIAQWLGLQLGQVDDTDAIRDCGQDQFLLLLHTLVLLLNDEGFLELLMLGEHWYFDHKDTEHL
jgi:hypothetical protein